MNDSYLEVTFRHGTPLAAYYYLPRQPGDTVHRVEKFDAGLLVDLTEDGRPIGLEITIPALVTVEAVNRVMQSFGFAPITPGELAPLGNAA